MREHVLVIPVFGTVKENQISYWLQLRTKKYSLCLVDNNTIPDSQIQAIADIYLHNSNKHGIAGAINRALSTLTEMKSYHLVSILDQDSLISSKSLMTLGREVLELSSTSTSIVGPTIWDIDRFEFHTSIALRVRPYIVRSLILSGITFRLDNWLELCDLPLSLDVDFLDIAWCSQLIAKGIMVRTSYNAFLYQTFGMAHPNILCKVFGMQYYSPQRHYYSIKNLKSLWLINEVALRIKINQTLRMFVKICFWIVFETNKGQNLVFIAKGILA